MTQGKRDATSSNIADYDQFAQTQASLNPSLTGTSDGVQWKALGSTSTVDARDHLGLLNFPIFLLDGTTKISTTGQIWSEGIVNPISLNQFAVVNAPNPVWTGTENSGVAYVNNNFAFPFSGLGSPFPAVGRSDNLENKWVLFTRDLNTIDYPMYAFSSQLTVQAVPEPSSIMLFIFGLGGWLIACRNGLASKKIKA